MTQHGAARWLCPALLHQLGKMFQDVVQLPTSLLELELLSQQKAHLAFLGLTGDIPSGK
jgi:hypothetical protein